jgi:hypothetical protein
MVHRKRLGSRSASYVENKVVYKIICVLK